MSNNLKKIPVILDTDIGGDIDDTWALAMMLKSPELDVKLITTDTGNTLYRAKIVGKMLETAGISNIPIGIGIKHSNKIGPQGDWVDNYDLTSYSGKVYEDGVDALIKTIMDSPDQITLICIGPLPNIGEALRREPKIVTKCRFVGMHGSVRKGYKGNDTITTESNVKISTADCQKVFTADWDMTITPLDTCGLVKLKGEDYQKVRMSKDPLVKSIIENYKIWDENCTWHQKNVKDRNLILIQSTTLFDTVAVYLAYSEKYLNIERLGIRVTDDGHTVIDDNAKKINCATSWQNLNAFKQYLTNRIIS